MLKKSMLVSVLMMSAMLVGCASTHDNNVYSSHQIGSVQTVKYGTVTGIRPVTLSDSDKQMPVGAAAGAVLGGVAGYAVGGGSGQKIAAVGGAILGGLLGNAVQTEVGESDGWEIVVRTDNGQDLAVIQGMTERVGVGTRVQLVESGGRVKVSPVGG
ncbi:Outer membrane lipoprotein SlyB precursor [compost metagenome]